MLIIMVAVNCGTKGDVVKRSDCILVYRSTTKGDVVKSTTKGDVVKRFDCILVYGSTTKGDVVKRSDCIQGCCCKEVRLYNSVWEHYQGWCCKEV